MNSLSFRLCLRQVPVGFSSKCNSIYNIIPLLKKKKMFIYSLALEVIIITRMRISNPLGKTWPWRWTVSSVKSTDVTCKTHSGQLAAHLPLLVNLASLVRDVDRWLSGRDFGSAF